MKGIILLVEDESDLVLNLKEILEFNDFKVITAINGLDALSKLGNISVDLILCDIVMPIMDGYQFFSLVKGDQKFQNIPFFFISAKASYMDKSSGLRNGATKYLAKPISARVLLQELNEVLSKHS